jgi:hypothetical protein
MFHKSAVVRSGTQWYAVVRSGTQWYYHTYIMIKYACFCHRYAFSLYNVCVVFVQCCVFRILHMVNVFNLIVLFYDLLQYMT